ncbi:hypothetical protein H072_3280 [Dactylellina haptotyla CBS 200.50]|uniref:G-patch domain-containing protein n=1 Tax=Dactylellina haptotyla (strain CBS 200.50) TaxID=1284197 RepID=S8AIA0_DACHA|nr:hypothetical protein H072_3280 [Dactylellina haptotyla CBS 200.50]
MMKRSKLSMQVAYESDSSQADSDENADFADFPNPSGDNEFDTASHRRKRVKRSKKDAKEAAALGVFGSESDEDEYNDYSRSSKGKRGFRNLREGGMSFVKTGQAAEDDDDDDDDDDDEEEEEEEEDDDTKKDDFSVEATAGLRDFGTGRGNDGYSEEEDDQAADRPRTSLAASLRAGLGAGGGLGFKPGSKEDKMNLDDESADDRPSMGAPSGFGASLKPPMFAPRFVGGGRTAPTSGTATPASLDSHRGLGFQSGGTSSMEHSPAPESEKPLFNRAGLGGLGFRKAGTIDSADLENQPIPVDHMDEDEPAERTSISAPLGKGFMSSIRQNAMMFAAAAEEDEPEVKEKPKIRPSFTDTRGMKKGKGDGPNVNKESFAARMMAKMGYVQGQGLGKTGEGRLAPVDTQLRPTRVGLGAVREKTEQAKKEEKRAKILKGEEPSESDSEKERKRRKKKKAKGLVDSAGGSGASTPARRKPQFKTAEEMSKELAGLEVPSVLKNIIDFTGKQARTLDVGSPGLMLSGAAPQIEDENVKIAKLARRELEDFAREWKRLQERKAFLKLEEQRMTEDTDEQRETVKALQGIVGTIESLSIDTTSAESRNDYEDKIAKLATELESLQFKYKNEVELYDLSEVAIAAFHPLFKSALAHWDPLTDPVYLLDHIRKLRHIFSIRTQEDMEASLAATGYAEKSGKKSTFYESMMYNVWLPKIRSTINNSWNVHDPTPVLTILETWSGVLPPFITANILNQLVLPKLKTAVGEWNPRVSSSSSSSSSSKRKTAPPPHVWVFPWLPHLSAHMDDLVREVKRKFRVILDKWDLYKGAVDGLEAWKEVFGPGELEKMLISHLLPRLADLLRRKFEVNPADQDVRPVEAVMAWHGFFRQSTFAQLLEAEFFPKWMQTLYQWLTMDGVDLGEVSEWYEWWQEQFPKEVRESVMVKREFKKAVDMMSQAMEVEDGVGGARVLPPESGAAKPIRPSPPPAGKGKAKGKANGASGKSSAAAPTDTTFREYMEEWCAEHGFLLMALRKAHESTGYPLFRITENVNGSGGILCYFNQDVVWAQDKKKKESFEPTSLEKIQQRVEASHH